MAESNNKDKITLPGVIYHDIKNYLTEKKEIRQRKKAENRKIKFREIFIENCKKGYHAVRYRYYAHKEKQILQGNSELENIQAKKAEEANKFIAHDESIKVMQTIREEQKAAKEGVEDSIEKIQSENNEPLNVEAPVNVTKDLQYDLPEVPSPVWVEQPSENVDEPSIVAEEQNNITLPVENKTPEVVQPVEMDPEVQASLAEGTQEILDEQNKSENKIPEVEQPTREVLGQKLTDILRTESQNRQAQQTVNSEVQTSLAESNKERLDGKNKSEDVDISIIIGEIEKLGKSVAYVQQIVLKSIASKQRELDFANKEIKKLTNSNAEKDKEIDSITALYNDKMLYAQSKDEEIASLRQQLSETLVAKETAEKEKNIFENQFKDYVANTSPIVEKYNSMVSLMGGMPVKTEVQPEVANEENHQKINRI